MRTDIQRKKKGMKVLTEKIKGIKSAFSDINSKASLIGKLSEIKLGHLKGPSFLIHLFIIFSLIAVMNIDVGYSVIVNNKNYGTVSSMEEAEKAMKSAMYKIGSAKGEDYAFEHASCNLTLVRKDNIISEKQAEENIITALDGLMSAYAVYVDGEVAVALDNINEAKEILNDIKLRYKTDNNEVSFYNSVYVKEARVNKSKIKNKYEAEEILNKEKIQAVVHTVKEGETIGEIAENYGISQSEIHDNNPDVVPELLKVGEELCIKAPVSLIQVKAVSQEVCVETIPFETKVKNDVNRYQGTTVVSVEGVNGKKNVTYENIMVNGVLAEKNVLSEEIISNPVDKVVLSGTKPKPKNAPTGTFLRPYYGSITSRFG